MTSAPVRDPVADHLIRPQNVALLLFDYQPAQAASVRSMEHDLLVKNAVSAVRTIKAFGVPVVHSTVNVAPARDRRFPNSRAARGRQTARPDDGELLGRHRVPRRPAAEGVGAGMVTSYQDDRTEAGHAEWLGHARRPTCRDRPLDGAGSAHHRAGPRGRRPGRRLALRKAVRALYGLDHLPAEEEVLAIAENWRPYPSLATAYLFSAALGDTDVAAQRTKETS
jgi:hypothetical protein